MLTEFVSLSWPQHARAYFGTLTNSSVPSKYSAFCNHFGTGHQGKSQHEPKHQQRSSICCTARPDTKALSQKTYIFIHSVLAQRKAHSTVCFKCIYPDVTKHKQRLSNWRSRLCSSSLQRKPIYLLIYWVSGGLEHMRYRLPVLTIPQTQCSLPTGKEIQPPLSLLSNSDKVNDKWSLCLSWVNRQSVDNHWAVWELS